MHLGILESVEPMILLSQSERGVGEINIHHGFGSTGQGRHGKTAGKAEQVEDFLALGALTNPAPPLRHIGKEAQILSALEIQLVDQPILLRQRRRGQFPTHQHILRSAVISMLDDQSVTAQGDQCFCQAGLQRFQHGLVLGTEYRGHQYRRKAVDGQPLQGRHSFSPAVEKAVAWLRAGNQIRGKQVRQFGGLHRTGSACGG